MRIRSYRPEDAEAIDRIWKEHWQHDFSVPDRSHAIIDAVIEDDSGQVIAYGQVKLFAEAVMVLDLNQSEFKRASAVRLLMHEAFRGTKDAGINDLYSFSRSPDLVNLIRKHFGFELCENPGELLLRRFSDGWRQRETENESAS